MLHISLGPDTTNSSTDCFQYRILENLCNTLLDLRAPIGNFLKLGTRLPSKTVVQPQNCVPDKCHDNYDVQHPYLNF